MGATFTELQGCSPYTLAARWLDCAEWPTDAEHDAEARVAELAVMCALQAWLRRWLPLHVHRALAAGSTVEQVCAATGLSRAGVQVAWVQWAAGQRHLHEHTPSGQAPAGLSPGEYARVRGVLFAAPPG